MKIGNSMCGVRARVCVCVWERETHFKGLQWRIFSFLCHPSLRDLLKASKNVDILSRARTKDTKVQKRPDVPGRSLKHRLFSPNPSPSGIISPGSSRTVLKSQTIQTVWDLRTIQFFSNHVIQTILGSSLNGLGFGIDGMLFEDHTKNSLMLNL